MGYWFGIVELLLGAYWMMSDYISDRAGAVAIIAMGGRWPGAGSPEALWQLIVNGQESIRQLNDDELEFDVRKTAAGAGNQRVVSARAVLEDVDQFDASFFGVYPKEAELMDPQHRLFLECAWETIEQAGYNPETYPGMVGVFAGQNQNSYLMYNLCPDRAQAEEFAGGCHPSNYQLTIGNGTDFLPSRVAYKFNLKGPAIALQTACSTSLVAVNQACVNLLTYQCDMALAGGVALSLPQRRNYFYDTGGMLSGDGHCRPFDAKALGTVFGNGVGVVALKRLDDALKDGDQIRGVILGSAINNDGLDKIGYAAPSINQQAAVVQLAQEIAGVSPDMISYIETHGTGTPLGDPIEMAALTKAFRAGTDKNQFCAIGSVKANIGHMDAAAGITGVIKTVLCLEHNMLPPILHFETPNPHIDFERSPFYPLKELTPWEPGATVRRAGVSAFGVGGTNAHAILEEGPTIESGSKGRGVHALVLSAKTDSALRKMQENLADYLEKNEAAQLADVAFTLQCGRKRFEHRMALSCRTKEEAVNTLRRGEVHRRKQNASGAEVAFLFPGQGAQYPGMGCELYATEPVYKEAVDQCAALLEPIIQEDIRTILFPKDGAAADPVEQLNQTRYTQPCIFITEYALAKLWMSWGIRPAVVIGHSIGEYVAAVFAGTFTLQTAIEMLAERARLIQSLPGGSMLAVRLPEDQAADLLTSELSIAALNGPELTVVSGTDEAIHALASRLAEQEMYGKVLATSHGFHSPMMEPILADFSAFAERYTFHEPQLKWISTLTGKPVVKADVCTPDYWAKQIRNPVRFTDAVEHVLASSDKVLLEVGPGRALGSMLLQHPAHKREQSVVSSLSPTYCSNEDAEYLMLALGDLWMGGVEVDWAAFYQGERRLRVRLPSYPFERKSFWVAAPEQGRTDPAPGEPRPQLSVQTPQEEGPSKDQDEISTHDRLSQLEQELSELVQELSGLDVGPVEEEVSFVEMGVDSLLAFQLFSAINQRYELSFPVSTLYSAPTVKALAKLISASSFDVAMDRKYLFEFSNQVPDKKLFCVHAILGGALLYADLAKKLVSTCSFYGIDAPWLMEKVRAKNIKETAADYLSLLRSEQPVGPYLLAGYSYGGLVAYEIACQLESCGEVVEKLILLDSENPAYQPERRGLSERMMLNRERIQGASLNEKIRILGRRTVGKIKAVHNREKDRVLTVLGNWTERWLGRNLFRDRVSVEVARNVQFIHQYRPRPYAGNVVLIEALHRDEGFSFSKGLGWDAVVTGSVKVYEVPCDHGNVLTAEDLPKILSEVLS
jgi:acyl transferase domain-containing protein/thioesterase domain-containing protein